MTSPALGLPEALERAASALPAEAEEIRPANGDPVALLERLEAGAAARVLEWLLVHETEAGAELADAWSEDREAGAEPLLRVRSEALPKAGRKALRRARHRLRSRGVAVPEEAPSQRVATLPPVDDRLDEALVSSIDPRGTRAVYLVEAHPAGGARVFELLLDEDRGVVRLEVFGAGRRNARQFLREFSRRDHSPAVSAPPVSVRALVERIARDQPADRPLPRGFSEWRSSIAAPPEGAATPGELARQALGDDPDEAGLERAAELVREGALGPWLTPSDALRGVAEGIGEVARSPIVVSGSRRRERAEQVLEQAMDEIFAGPVRARTAARFEESAYVLWKGGREADARACLAAAKAFREKGPAEHPVARALLRVLLAPVLGKLEDETEGESLLVRP